MTMSRVITHAVVVAEHTALCGRLGFLKECTVDRALRTLHAWVPAGQWLGTACQRFILSLSWAPVHTHLQYSGLLLEVLQ